MDYYTDPAMADLLRGSSQKGPVPRRGQEKAFDEYCDNLMNGLDAEETDFMELRKAAWATWRVEPPSRTDNPTRSTRDQEDEELARVLAMSAQEADAQFDIASQPVGDDDVDEELKKAIAMSEEDARALKRQKREETPEEERKMLEEAMKASMAQEEAPVEEPELPGPGDISGSTDSSKSTSITTPAEIAPTLPPVLSGRAQMEQERIARQKAREGQNGSSQPSAPTTSHAKPVPSTNSRIATMSDLNRNAEAGPSSSNNVRPINGSKSAPRPPTHHPLQSRGPFPTDAAGEYYLDGEMRHNALSIGRASTAPTFSPQHIVGKQSEISLLVMCSFVIDDNWLNTVLPPPELVPTVLIRPHAKENHSTHNGKVQVQENKEVWCYPRMIGEWGSAHMKFFWIFYKTGRARVVISTANMVDYDWNWIENSIFIQDFLPRSSPTNPTTSLGDDFLDRFRDLLIHMKVHKAIKHLKESHPFGKRISLDPSEALQDLSNYDFSKVRVKLVMSVPGKYTGFDQMNEFGLCRLGNLLKEAKWVPPTGEKIVGEYQGSSLGNYTLEWIDTFYRFMNGNAAKDLVGRPKAKEWPSMKVLFPSLATVEASELGKEGGGTMFVGQSWKAVTKHLFHDAKSQRGGVLMHSKVLVALFEKQNNPLGLEGQNGKKRKADSGDGGENIGGWAYMGSHNFTPSAWGNVKLNDKPPTMSISNYEIGIVFPLPRENAQKAADALAPFSRLARPYGPTDVPWDQRLKGEGKLAMHTPK